MSLSCSIGIMAYNEERNIGQLLEALVRQRTKNVCLREMIVVSSGCTDNTGTIVRQWSLLHRRVRLLGHSNHEGKTLTMDININQTTEKIAGLCSADLMPE